MFQIVIRCLWDRFDLYLWETYQVPWLPEWSQALKFTTEVWYTDIRMTPSSLFAFLLPFSSRYCHGMTFRCQNILTHYLVIRWHWQGPPSVMNWTSSLKGKWMELNVFVDKCVDSAHFCPPCIHPYCSLWIKCMSKWSHILFTLCSIQTSLLQAINLHY